MPRRVGAPDVARPAPLDPAATMRTWAEGVDLRGSRIARSEVARTRAATTGPEALRRAFLLHRAFEENDLGNAHLYRVPGGGFAIHTTTDGDPGYLELFSAEGALLASGVTGFRADGAGGFLPAITWDDVPGAVREHLAPRDASPSVAAFSDAIDAAARSRSPSGRTISTNELKAAAKGLVTGDRTIDSVDRSERSSLRRLLADDTKTLSAGARELGTNIADLYTWGAPAKLTRLRTRSLASETRLPGDFAEKSRFASASLPRSKKEPAVGAFVELARQGFAGLPAELLPVTRTEALAALRAAGATASEARATLGALGTTGSRWLTSRVVSTDAVPADLGTAVFAASADGKKVSAVFVPESAPPQQQDVRDLVRRVTGVDREVTIAAEHAGPSWDLEWRPPWGGVVGGHLALDAQGAPTIDHVSVPPVFEPNMAQSMVERLAPRFGRVDLAGWAGNDDARGVGFLVAFAPEGQRAPVRVADVRIALGGAATVEPRVVRAEDAEVAAMLALHVARAHAAKMVSDPAMPEAAKLEVALRTAWAMPADLARTERNSPIGFGRNDEMQFELPRVFGDNAVFVTFAKDGTVRVEDAN